jgi:hypothetical protein
MKLLSGLLLLATGFALAFLSRGDAAIVRPYLPTALSGAAVLGALQLGLWMGALVLANLGAADFMVGIGLWRISLTAHRMLAYALMLLTSVGLLLMAAPGKFEARDTGLFLGWCLGLGVLLGALESIGERIALPWKNGPGAKRPRVKDYVAPPV